MDNEENRRKALEPIVNYIESVMASYSKEELEARIKKALPEKESEDERIRKSLVEYFRKFTPGNMWDEMFSFGDVVSYLEKQKEQKSAEWSEKYIADVFEKVGLSKIVREQGNDALTNAVQSAMIELSKVGNAERSEKIRKELVYFLQKEKDYLESVVKPENSPKLRFLIDALAYLEKQKEQQPNWKPSEEYMQALEIVLDYHAFASSKNRESIKSLYEELKKL